MAAAKGNSYSPGRPKGAKDKVSRKVKLSIMQVWDKLEKGKKGLHATAKDDPQWFYVNFVKPMIPKEVEAELGVSETFAEIIRTVIKK